MRRVNWPSGRCVSSRKREGCRHSLQWMHGRSGWLRALPSCSKRQRKARMPKQITDDDLALLEELGVPAEATQLEGRSAKEQRIIAGFEEIERFIEEHGRVPQHGEDRDI